MEMLYRISGRIDYNLRIRRGKVRCRCLRTGRAVDTRVIVQSCETHGTFIDALCNCAELVDFQGDRCIGDELAHYKCSKCGRINYLTKNSEQCKCVRARYLSMLKGEEPAAFTFESALL